jgi:hypothetical protein
MSLEAIQGRLGALYDLAPGASVTEFLCDAETARTLGGDQAPLRGEVLFVVEDAEGPRVALYVEPSAREVGDEWLGPRERFRACCLATEGVSHFVLVALRAEHGDRVSELELELQAEIDKWALALLAPRGPELLVGRGAGLVAFRERSRRLRARLFEEVGYLDAPGTERGDRYRAATRLAARYTHELERRFVDPGDLAGLTRELRRFYRLGARSKLERLG